MSRGLARTEPPRESRAGVAGGERLRIGALGKGWWVAAVVVAVVLVVGGVSAARWSSDHQGSGAGQSPAQSAHAKLVAQLADAVKTDPSNGASGVVLDAPVSVSTTMGTLTSVKVAPMGGQPVAGTLSVGGNSWTTPNGGSLSGGTRYQIRASVRGRSGVDTTVVSSFTTLTPTAMVSASLWPDDGLTVGVGQPIVLKFTQPITNSVAQASVLQHISVQLSDPVPVGAYWFSPTELHLRPENYWPVGEQIYVVENLSGWNATGGVWGTGLVTVRFGVGASHIATANLQTDEMTVTDNGNVVATYPISGGRTEYPTMDGVHIVLDKEPQVQMISSTVGIPVNSPNGYDETVYWDVHISDSGEYVHAAPWSVADQGVTNVSHGCINVSTANAQSFYNFSQIGDVVDVVGGPRPPAPGDHGVMDWSTPWSDFTPMPVEPLG